MTFTINKKSNNDYVLFIEKKDANSNTMRVEVSMFELIQLKKEIEAWKIGEVNIL